APAPAPAPKLPPPPPPLKVGFVYASPIGEAGWTFSHDLGRRAIEARFGAKIETRYVENVTNEDVGRVMREMARDGVSLIFGTAYGYGKAMFEVASEFPHAHFEHATGIQTAPNLSVYDARTYQGAYLMGLVAGKMTKTDRLGFVASVPVPAAIRNINAFALGAREANPKAVVSVAWVNEWFNPDRERLAAEKLIEKGADVLTQNTGSTAVVKTATEKGVRAFGWDSDMSRFGAAQLGASVIEWGIYYARVVDDVLNDRWLRRMTWWGLKEGMVDLAFLSADVPDGVRQLLAKRRDEIASDEALIWTGPIRDQRGVVRVPADKTLSDGQLDTMNFYVEGVEGVVPK
ncbi:MAG: BMP family ABC transporter substrate-binding protein, partial [Gammaproteobacteria bacterium]